MLISQVAGGVARTFVSGKQGMVDIFHLSLPLVLPVIGSDSDGATLTIRTSSTTSSTWIWGEFHVQIYFTGQIKVFRGGYVSGSSTLIATSTERAVSFNHWHTMEVMVKLATDATGAYEIKVDGQTVMSGTNVQTCVTASTVPNRILLGPGKNAAFYSHVAVNDDTGSYNNTWVGDAYIESLFPTSDTSVAFTPLSGTVNYAMVDDVTPDANTSYVYATATGLTDQYSYGNLSYVGSVDAVVHNIEAANLGTDTTPDIHTFIVSGTTTATSATHTMNSAYNRWLADIHDTDPNTGAAWNGTDVDAIEGGVESL